MLKSDLMLKLKHRNNVIQDYAQRLITVLRHLAAGVQNWRSLIE